MAPSSLPSKQERHWLAWSVWSVLATLSGFLFWKLFGYGRKLFRQPRLAPRDNPLLDVERAVLEKMALSIATGNLRAGVEKRRLPDGQEKLVLCAGVRHFREPWARDFGFASFGLVELGEWEVTRQCLEVFLLNQRSTGQFPVKVHATGVWDRYMYSLFSREQPVDAPIKPKYITAHNTISPDGNALLIIAALNYARRSGDGRFLKAHWKSLKLAATWLSGYAPGPDGLIHQSPFADWADSVARAGRILYTNVLYWKALHDLAHAAADYDFATDRQFFVDLADQIKQSINTYFWREDLGYFVTSQMFDNLSSCGNLLAVAWGLASARQAHSVLDKMNDFGMAEPVPTQVVHRPYPREFIAIENRLGGIGNYHTSAAWLWLGAWHVIALTRARRMVEAEACLHRLSRIIVRDGAVHEVYDPSGHYLSTFWYTSEAPLTWSAGMVVYASYVYQRRLYGGGFETFEDW